MSTIDRLFQQSIQSHQTGDFVRAANGYAKVLSAQPNNADAWHLAGVLAYQNGRPSDGLNQIEMAIELKPNNAEYHANLAAILNGIGQYDAALNVASKATEIDLNFAPGHFQTAKALGSLHRFFEALQSFDLAVNCGGDVVAISMEVANILQMQGQIKDAISQLENVLLISPGHPQAYLELAKFVSSGDFTFSDEQMLHLEKLAGKNQSFSLDDQARLYSSLAVSTAQKKDFATASHHFGNANRCLAEHFRRTKLTEFCSTSSLAFVESSVRHFDQSRVASSQVHGNSSHLPIFVVGMPRSGTTLIHQLLSNHNSIEGLGELTEIPDLFAELFDFPTCNKDNLWKKLSPSKIQAASEQYLKHVSSRLGNRKPQRIVDKMPGNYNFLGFIKTLFPNSKIIHCIRDPRDACLSCYTTLFKDPNLQSATSSITNIAEFYRSYDRIMKHWKQLFKSEIYDLSYRRLVLNPSNEINSLLSFLNLPFQNDCVQISPSNESAINTASVAQARKPIHSQSLGRWQDYAKTLSPLLSQLDAEIAEFESAEKVQLGQSCT